MLAQLISWVASAVARIPMQELLFDPPRYSTLPRDWLRLNGVTTPPLVCRVGVRNFGGSVATKLRVKLNLPWPDYSVEVLGMTVDAVHFRPEQCEIELDQLDPGCTATFLLFYDRPPHFGNEPMLLVDGRRVGRATEWLSMLRSAPYAWLLATASVAFGVAAVGYVGVTIYDVKFSPEARTRAAFLAAYQAENNLRECNVQTLRKSDGNIDEAQVRRHIAGVADAMRLNRSSSLEELLRREMVLVCVAPS
jgi:hypothetical protein